MPPIQGDNFGSCGVSATKQRPGKKVMRIHIGRPSSMGGGFAASRLSANSTNLSDFRSARGSGILPRFFHQSRLEGAPTRRYALSQCH